jgi:phosphatidylinositol 4-kinase
LYTAQNGNGAGLDISETVKNVESTLSQLYERTYTDGEVPIDELREALRRAAALLCNSNDSQPSIIHFLVGIPFRLFTKESIKLGVSLWLGVIHENPRTEPRILAEVAEAWERTIRRKRGMFDPSFE